MGLEDTGGAGVSELSLDRLPAGQAGVIREVAGDSALRARLRDLGFREGEVVVAVKSAPLADPVEYWIQGAHISLRRAEARCIRVGDVHAAAWRESRAPHAGPAQRRRRRWGWLHWPLWARGGGGHSQGRRR